MRIFLLALLFSVAACTEPTGDRGYGEGDTTDTTGPDSSPPTTTLGGPAEACRELINGYRTKVGAPALVAWTEGDSCADQEASNDSKSGQAHGSFGDCQESAQNECPGWPAPADKMIAGCLEMMWQEGPGGGHYDTMANDKYTQVSCGFATSDSGGIWAVQNFR